jgi:hypothetical protein
MIGSASNCVTTTRGDQPASTRRGRAQRTLRIDAGNDERTARSLLARECVASCDSARRCADACFCSCRASGASRDLEAGAAKRLLFFCVSPYRKRLRASLVIDHNSSHTALYRMHKLLTLPRSHVAPAP